MGITKLENQNLNDDVITSSKTSGMSVDSSKINSAITNDDISPSASLTTTKLDLSGIPSSQFVQMNNSGGTIDIQGLDEATFNIGLLGFKMAVTEGLTIFNLVDGVVDEFHDNTGVDTSESSNATYDASADTFNNSTTTMTLTMPISGDVNVEVYNVLGQVVSTLASGYMDASTYTLSWDASEASTGLYFVKATAEGFTKTQKLMLLK